MLTVLAAGSSWLCFMVTIVLKLYCLCCKTTKSKNHITLSYGFPNEDLKQIQRRCFEKETAWTAADAFFLCSSSPGALDHHKTQPGAGHRVCAVGTDLGELL